MATTFTETPIDADREREVKEARAEVLRRAEAQGAKPFTSIQDFAGDPELTADFDVDEFLRQVQVNVRSCLLRHNHGWRQAIAVW